LTARVKTEPFWDRFRFGAPGVIPGVRTHQSGSECETVGRSRPPAPPVFPARLTALIHHSRAGDAVASDALFAATYDGLRRLARARLRACRRHTFLDTGSLVHESYLRFPGAGDLNLEDRVHFMRWAGRVMRSVIVDMARRRHAGRRAAAAASVPLDVEPPAVTAGADEILRVHEALDWMTLLDARMTHGVEMRYFGGLTEDEIATALGVTTRTVRRDWEKARSLLGEVLH
jgi:RNA polymerase sigma factor (TIGR02999 family)